MNRPSMFARAAAAASVFALSATQALAHHPMGGKTPTTFMEGLLSGIGHPVIGPDHLAFVVAIGIAAALVPAGIGLIAAFISASTLGVLLRSTSLDIPLLEQLVALSVVAAGGLIAFGNVKRLTIWQPLAAVAGLIHGFALGEAIVGAERLVIGSYLLGIAIVASAIATAFMLATQWLFPVAAGAAVTVNSRLKPVGMILACVGIVMFAGSLIAV